MKTKLSILSIIVFTSMILISCSNSTYALKQNNTTQKSQINLVSNSSTNAINMIKAVPKNNTKNVPKNTNPVSKTYKIEIKDFNFSPLTLTIKKGDKVTWTNMDSMAHTATGANFDSGNLNFGKSFSFIFNTVGEFNYVCSYHSNMKAKIIVK